ncbi:lysozyme-like domain [Trichoderma arundinaceum]|uniref:Lysozyme-like domain n=1 Tax=Trichoderma arundinaceum TaxID=490622 RepID=A0A395P546_TRIAR|nr:lysozyme-like domain [Trichoderma arundinaceum]
MLGNIAIVVTGLAAFGTALPAAGCAVKRTSIADKYTYYQGDGSSAAGWPSQDAWGTWDDLWNANVPLMQKSCVWNGWVGDDSDSEIQDIANAIKESAKSTGVDERFILAVMMQESKGCVRVPTTNNGVTNPGLMQSHNGAGTCFGTSPCPSSSINLMINDGVSGTSEGDGLQQLLSQAEGQVNNDGSQAYYAAARLYNSGSADYSNLDNGLGSTACYVSDVANRLTGWTLATSTCA